MKFNSLYSQSLCQKYQNSGFVLIWKKKGKSNLKFFSTLHEKLSIGKRIRHYSTALLTAEDVWCFCDLSLKFIHPIYILLNLMKMKGPKFVGPNK